MNRLQKFVEQGAGQKPRRTAYVFGPSSLPEPNVGMDWRAVPSFNAAEESLQIGLRTWRAAWRRAAPAQRPVSQKNRVKYRKHGGRSHGQRENDAAQLVHGNAIAGLSVQGANLGGKPGNIVFSPQH
jgi:hypothetical protein